MHGVAPDCGVDEAATVRYGGDAMHRSPRWLLILLVGLALPGLSSCGSPTPTAAEYADEIEDLVGDMEERFAAADAAWEAETPSLDGALAYWDERLDIREDFIDDLEEMRYPPEVADMHDAALEVFRRITAADVAIAESVRAYPEVTEHRPWLDTPEGQASLAVLEDVFAFCRESQAEFDATTEREGLEDVPWLPSEMSQVIKVAFGCPPAE